MHYAGIISRKEVAFFDYDCYFCNEAASAQAVLQLCTVHSIHPLYFINNYMHTRTENRLFLIFIFLYFVYYSHLCLRVYLITSSLQAL